MTTTVTKIDRQLMRKMEYHELQKKKLEWDRAVLDAEIKEMEYNQLKSDLEAKEMMDPIFPEGGSHEMATYINKLPVTRLVSDEEVDIHLDDINPPQFNGVPIDELEKTVMEQLTYINKKEEPETDWTSDPSVPLAEKVRRCSPKEIYKERRSVSMPITEDGIKDIPLFDQVYIDDGIQPSAKSTVTFPGNKLGPVPPTQMFTTVTPATCGVNI